jgi:hypothetical protein
MRVSTVYLIVGRAILLLAAARLAACAGDIEPPLRTTMGPAEVVPEAPAIAATTVSIPAAAAGSAAPAAQPTASAQPVQTSLAPYSELPDGRGGTNL